MTKDELRKHCERICARYAEANRVTKSLTYEEHKLVLDLLDTDDVLTKALVIQALEDVRAEIHKLAPERGMWEIDGDKVKEAVIETLIDVDAIIDRKIKEIKHECSSCTHSDEVDGEHCYECVKCLANNFEADEGEELTNPFGDNSEIFGG